MFRSRASRHGHELTWALDIEDVLQTLAFIGGKKWTSMLIKRVYFGNWLRDYSQAVDVGSLKGANAATIRILVGCEDSGGHHPNSFGNKSNKHNRSGFCPPCRLAMRRPSSK